MEKIFVVISWWFHLLCPVDEESKSKEVAEVEVTDKELEEKKTCPPFTEEAEKDEKVTKACSCQSDSSASSEDSVISSDKVRLTSSQ